MLRPLRPGLGGGGARPGRGARGGRAAAARRRHRTAARAARGAAAVGRGRGELRRGRVGAVLAGRIDRRLGPSSTMAILDRQLSDYYFSFRDARLCRSWLINCTP